MNGTKYVTEKQLAASRVLLRHIAVTGGEIPKDQDGGGNYETNPFCSALGPAPAAAAPAAAGAAAAVTCPYSEMRPCVQVWRKSL